MSEKQLVRCLKIITYLTPQFPISAGELAEELSVSRRQIIRDVKIWRKAGLAIEGTSTGYVAPDPAQIREILGMN